MFCPKCGTKVPKEAEVCTNCGLDFNTINQNVENNNEVETVKGKEKIIGNDIKKEANSIVKFTYFGIATITLIMFFMAASKIADGGLEIMHITSVGGTTLEEAYYAELGIVYAGYAMITRALGISIASILVWLGIKV